MNNFYGLFDDNLAQEGGGSSVALRTVQFQIGFQMFEQNPLFGNGVGSITQMMSTSSKFEDLLGAESSWLKILPERGIIGAIVYIILYYSIYKKLKAVIPNKTIILFLGGLMAMETATGFMDFPLFGAIIITIYRIHLVSSKLPQYESLPTNHCI